MIWLTYRQFRVQAAVVFAAVVAAAITLAATGPHLARMARLDGSVFDRLSRADRNLLYAGIVVLAVAPAVIGAFWGAPMVARELEAGTHRLVWNQSVTRTRWLATKLVITLLAAAVAVGALTLAITWWSSPVDGALSDTHGSLPSRLTPVSFAMRGIVPVGYVVFAVTLGVATGVVLRRSLPAMAVTLVVFTAVQVMVPLWVRPHLVTPTRETVTFSRSRLDGIMADEHGNPSRITANTGSQGAWVPANQTVDAEGRVSKLPAWTAQCFGPPPPSTANRQPAQVDLDACLARLTAEGYRQHLVYLRAGRFWSLQWAETALYLLASGVLGAFSFWWVRKRVA